MLKNIFKTSRIGIYLAEIGMNHNGDFNMACRMVEAAAESGADGVKFQIFVPEFMNSVYTTDLLENGVESNIDMSQTNFFKKFVFKQDEYFKLKELAEKLDMVFFASPFDQPSIEILENINVTIYKIASSELTNIPLIKLIAETGKPLIMSTGIAAEEEIEEAINNYNQFSSSELILLHCVSLYPLELENLNINRIESLKKRFNIEVGFSDHTRGISSAVIAAAAGARIFEKHFTIDRNYNCPDKDVSVNPDEFSEMIKSVEETILSLGNGEITYSEAESETARAARRSLFAKKFIPEGKIIEKDDIIALRPGTGISVNKINTVIGKVSKVDIKKDYIIRQEYLDLRS